MHSFNTVKTFLLFMITLCQHGLTHLLIQWTKHKQPSYFVTLNTTRDFVSTILKNATNLRFRLSKNHLGFNAHLFAHIPILGISIGLFLLEQLPSLASLSLFSYLDIEAGQWWRLLTGGYLHSHFWHLSLNLCALWLIYFLFAPYSYSKYASLLFFVFNTLVNSAIWMFSPQTLYYVGLSGTLHSLFCFGACLLYLKQPKLSILMLCAITIKIALEQLYNTPILTQAWVGSSIHYDAHFYGWCIGLITGLFFHFLLKARLFLLQSSD